jgi:hypothetical protein
MDHNILHNITTSLNAIQHNETSNMSLYVHIAFFLAIALFMRLDADVLERFLDSDHSDHDRGAVDVDEDRRLQAEEEDEVGGFGLQINLITDDAFVPESTAGADTSATAAIVLVIMVACVLVLAGAGIRHCVIRKGAMLAGKRKKKTYDVEEVNINNFQKYELTRRGSIGDNSETGSNYYSDSTPVHDKTAVFD